MNVLVPAALPSPWIALLRLQVIARLGRPSGSAVLRRGNGGEYVALWDTLPQRWLMITHPLGGCTIGSYRTRGAIDALAVNPTLTITARALKAVGHALGSAAVSAPRANP